MFELEVNSFYIIRHLYLYQLLIILQTQSNRLLLDNKKKGMLNDKFEIKPYLYNPKNNLKSTLKLF